MEDPAELEAWKLRLADKGDIPAAVERLPLSQRSPLSARKAYAATAGRPRESSPEHSLDLYSAARRETRSSSIVPAEP